MRKKAWKTTTDAVAVQRDRFTYTRWIMAT